MRKDKKLTRLDRVTVYINAEPSLISALNASIEEIKSIVKADKIELGKDPAVSSHSREWDIMGAKISIGIERSQK